MYFEGLKLDFKNIVLFTLRILKSEVADNPIIPSQVQFNVEYSFCNLYVLYHFRKTRSINLYIF